MDFRKYRNLPNYLTIIRLISSILFSLILVPFLSLNFFYINLILTFVFIALSLTDIFDGYFARKYKLESNFGKALDPIADKFLVCFSLISLLAVNKIYYLWVIILIGREIFVMGLRQIALENNFSIAVSKHGKLKMILQIIMISVTIANPDYKLKLFESNWNLIQLIFIIITVSLSIGSAMKYYRSFVRSIKLNG